MIFNLPHGGNGKQKPAQLIVGCLNPVCNINPDYGE